MVPSGTIVDSLVGYQITTYIHVSGAALLISDWFFTLDMEIAHAWSSSWNLGTLLFFLTRYLVFVDTFVALYRQLSYSIPISTCAFLYTFGGWFVGFGILVAELILTIRVWALWERRRDIKIFLIIISIINASVGLVGYAFYGLAFKFIDIRKIFRDPHVASEFSGCFSNSGGKTLQWTFLALLVHQILIFVMTMIKGVQHYREGTYQTSLTYTFYRDGLEFYNEYQDPYFSALSIINLAILFSQPIMAYANLVTPIQRVLHSILSSRMLLHLRQESDALHSTGQDFNTLATLYYEGDNSEIERKSCSGSSLVSDIGPKTKLCNDPHTSTSVGNWFGKDRVSSHKRQPDSEA
ncbi:hypothetical protein BDZ94DRAFT_1307161 [Collybia nuda]|uniref:DUF6533 domain-containing protein n=1 Tax=Collybia nuda TaxID=64659 RepID=A0A9P6CGH8_9AGAR|nr:hypothetical protein BDZ94DRAFT_1307161 [Collybia nuda]